MFSFTAISLILSCLIFLLFFFSNANSKEEIKTDLSIIEIIKIYIINTKDNIINSNFGDDYLPISLSITYEYIFSTEPFLSDKVLPSFYKSVINLCASTKEMIISLCIFIYFILILIGKICIFLFPYLHKASTEIMEFHRTKLTNTDLLIEMVVIILFIVYMIFRKRIINIWNNIESSIARRSKTAAKAAPHILFFISSFIFCYFGQKFIAPLAKNFLLVVTLILPLISTVKIVYLSSIETEYIYYRQYITLWAIIATYHSITIVLTQIPYMTELGKLFPTVRELILVLMSWAQLSPVFTNIVYESFLPIIIYIRKCIPASSNFIDNTENQKTYFSNIVKSLKYVGIIGDKFERIINILLQDSVTVIIFFVFVMLPTRLARIGEVIISMLLPLFKSSNTLSCLAATTLDDKYKFQLGLSTAKVKLKSNNDNISSKTIEKSDSNGILSFLTPSKSSIHSMDTLDEKEIAVINERRRWLEYWIFFGIILFVKIYIMEIWPSIGMSLSLWLQHPYFSCSTKLLSNFKSIATEIKNREAKRIQENKILETENIKKEKLDDGVKND